MTQTEFSMADLEVMGSKEEVQQVREEVQGLESPLAGGEKSPTLESTSALFESINGAVKTFTEANPGVSQHLIMMGVMHSFLSFPYSWMKQAGSEDKFVEAMTSESMVYAYLVAKTELAQLKAQMVGETLPETGVDNNAAAETSPETTEGQAS
jgi:hypothetical protein